ncbi:hypothetical protein [Terriglobus albidus]|uniref:hypothetical protein n=1 Tax=Terriglobus albidus TaxID=1592106 RepID=UPI0021E0874E|nr:hypothetical protein [Terriglobus albidus]
MPSPVNILRHSEDEGLNLRLWTGMLLPPLAGGVNIVVGYIVSTYDCNVHNRHLVMLVNVLSLGVCGLAALMLSPTRARIEAGSDDPPVTLRSSRLFLRCLGLWFAAGFALLGLAGTLSTLILGACDL